MAAARVFSLVSVFPNDDCMILPFEAADLSVVIKEKLGNISSPPYVVTLEKYSSITLGFVSEYLLRQVTADDKMKRLIELYFLAGDVASVDMDLLLETVLAAHDLEIKGLEDLAAERIADRIKNKSVEWVRDVFGIEGSGGLTEAQVAEIEAQYPYAFLGVDPDEPSAERNEPLGPDENPPSSSSASVN